MAEPTALPFSGRVVEQHGPHDVGHDRQAVGRGDGFLLPVPHFRLRGRARIEGDLGRCLGSAAAVAHMMAIKARQIVLCIVDSSISIRR